MNLTLSQILRRPHGMVGALLITIFVLVGVFGPVIAPNDPERFNLLDSLEPPSITHPFGTDLFGRDILSRTLTAPRMFLWVGLLAVGIAATTGFLSGALFGRSDGKVGNFLRGLMTFAGSIPIVLYPIWAAVIPVMLWIAVILGGGYLEVLVLVGVNASVRLMPSFYSMWLPSAIEMDRERTSSQIPSDRPTAAVSTLFTLVVTGFGLAVGMAILLESVLSFLAIGVEPPQSSLGLMLNDGRGDKSTWTTIFPGVVILLGIAGYGLLAHSLREAYDRVVQPQRPWFYRTWFLILAFFLWPIWSILMFRSPWHRKRRWKGLAWVFAVVGSLAFVSYLITVPPVAIFASVPILILLAVILMQWNRVSKAVSQDR